MLFVLLNFVGTFGNSFGNSFGVSAAKVNKVSIPAKQNRKKIYVKPQKSFAMTDIQRIRKVINWLIYNDVASNERELSELLGYTKSSFSQIVNGKVPLSDKFIGKLCSLDGNINEVWIKTGSGSMFREEKKPIAMEASAPQPGMVYVPAEEAWQVIRMQTESLLLKDRQIAELMERVKKSGAHVAGDAGAVAAG